MKYKVLCTDGFSNTGLSELQKNKDLEVVFHPSLSHDELLNIIGQFDALIVRSASKVSSDVIEKGVKLKIIARAGVGTDNIDIKAATERGILVVNAPQGNTISTSELTFAMLMSLARNIPQASHAMADGKWEKKKFKGTEISRKTIGIIGLGRIGREVAKIAGNFDMKVLGFDPYLSKEQFESLKIVPSSVNDICCNADYITVHTPLTPETTNLITKKELDLMKPTSKIINCARGGIINEQDLADALRNKKIAGAALDVFTEEPLKINLFEGLENCILTPHLGASTKEAEEAVAVEAALVVSQYFSDGIGLNAINLAGCDQNTFKKFKPHIRLAEKMGTLAAQLSTGGFSKISFLSTQDMPRLLMLSVIKGSLNSVSSNPITIVNAESSALERGISISNEILKEKTEVENSIGIRLTSDNEVIEVWGHILGGNLLKISKCWDYRVDIDPEGTILFIHNEDKPGVIGKICTILGAASINIAEMQNVRHSKGDKALTIIGIDGDIDKTTLQTIASDPSITGVNIVRF